MSGCEEEIEVLYEDNHLLALFKPAGMLVQGDATGDLSLLDWAKGWLKRKYDKPGRVFLGLVHRLDRPVPGVVLFARTSKAARRLSEQFRARTVKKTYWAVIHGRMEPESGALKNHLVRRRNKTFLTTPEDANAKYAELRYTTLEAAGPFSLLEITLVTGRHHQIRAQLASLRRPIVGDVKYGAPGNGSKKRPDEGLALLAKRLVCRHPTEGVEMTFESPLPKNWPWPP